MFSQSVSQYLGSTTLYGVLFLGTGSFHSLLSFTIRPPYLTSLLLSEHTHTHSHTLKGKPHTTATQLLAPAAPTLSALLPDCIVIIFFADVFLSFLTLLDFRFIFLI